jgi:hypothetical protein
MIRATLGIPKAFWRRRICSTGFISCQTRTDFMLIRISNAAKEIPDGNFYRLCDTQQGFNGDNFFSAFDLTDIFWIQIHRFSQLLLSETGLFAINANGIANRFPMPQNRFFLRVRHTQRLPRPAYGLHQQHAGIYGLRFSPHSH